MDLVDCDDISDVGILQELSRRFQSSDIYSSIGPIIIALNPYASLPKLYDAATLSKFSNVENFDETTTGFVRTEKPHVWKVPAEAFNQLKVNKVPQALVISGESGAGKTETTKLCLQLLSSIANRDEENTSENYARIEDKVLATNPVLESFGNSKTARNNNSSRFGKWLQIDYAINPRINNGKPKLQGAVITQYLLEKSRVVQHAADERNYHIFYQLCANGVLDLQPAASYRYLKFSKLMKVPGIDDKKEFEATCQSMINLGFSDRDRETIFEIIKVILLCGNLVFAEDKSSDTNSAMISADYSALLSQIATLLGVGYEQLESSFLSRSLTLRGERAVVSFTVTQAQDAVNALAKEMYGRLFSFLIYKANVSLSTQHSAAGATAEDDMEGTTHSSIGLLDIFGFEKFKTNSFEQLCINYANEKLQQYFINYVLKKEQDLYLQESVSFDSITPIDNTDVLALLEARQLGLFSRLDDEIKIPKSTDESFIKKVAGDHNNTKIATRRFIKDVKMSLTQFEIRHFAGVIRYDAAGFMEKNRDKLFEHLEELLSMSSRPRFREIMTSAYLNTNEKADGGTASSASGSSAANATIAARFQSQLQQLVDVLNASEPHFIKCIKPNNNKQELHFDQETVLVQLRYSGILEAIQVRKSGYPIRRSHESFWKSYWSLWTGMSRQAFLRIPVEQRCQRLIEKLHVDFDMIRLGTTLAFCKSEVIALLEKRKQELRIRSSPKVQSLIRKFNAIHRVRRLRAIRADLLAKIKDGQQQNESNIAAIDSLSASLTIALTAGIPKPYTGQAQTLLRRLIQVKDCLDKLDRFLNKNAHSLTEDVPLVDEYRELLELSKSAATLKIQSPVLHSVWERLQLIQDRAEAVMQLQEAIGAGDEDRIQTAIQRVQQLVTSHNQEEFCAVDMQRAEEVMQLVAEDYALLAAAMEVITHWILYLNKEVQNKSASTSSSTSFQKEIKRVNQSLRTAANAWGSRSAVAGTVKLLMDTILRFESLHQTWLDKEWQETFDSIQTILPLCQADHTNEVSNAEKSQQISSYWITLSSLMTLEMKLIEQDLVQNYIIPKFVDRIHAGGILGLTVGGIDNTQVDYESLAHEIEEAKAQQFLQSALAPVLTLLDAHLELRSMFIDGRWDSVVATCESATQRESRRSNLSHWIQRLRNRGKFDEGFITEMDAFASASFTTSETSPTSLLATSSNNELLALQKVLHEEIALMLAEAIDRIMRKLLRYTLEAESLSLEKLVSQEGRDDFHNLEATFQVLQDLAATYSTGNLSHGSSQALVLPSKLTTHVLEGTRVIFAQRKYFLNGSWQTIYATAGSVVDGFLGPGLFDGDEACYLMKEQLGLVYARGCELFCEKRVVEIISTHAVAFPIHADAKQAALIANDQVQHFVKESEVKIQTMENFGFPKDSVLHQLRFVRILNKTRRLFYKDQRPELRDAIHDLQEVYEEMQSLQILPMSADNIDAELKAMELYVRYAECLTSLETAIGGKQPLKYFIPFEDTSVDTNTRSHHSRLKSMSSEFDMSSSANSMAVKDILKAESLMINEEDIDYRELLSTLNFAKEFQEEIEDEEVELPDEFLQLMEAADLLSTLRKSVVTSDFISAMKSLQSLMEKGYHKTIPAIRMEIDANLGELSNSGVVVVCMTALTFGKPSGPIGLFDYKTVITDNLDEAISICQSFNMDSVRCKSLFESALILSDLRKAQRVGDWKGVAEVLDKADALKIGRGYSEICFDEISRASVEKDNYDCIQGLRSALINEEIGTKDAFIDREGIATKELIAGLSKAASLPEDTRGPILKHIFSLAEAVLKMRKAAKDGEDYLSELYSIVSDSFDNFRNEMDNLSNPGAMQRKNSSMRMMRGTMTPKSKASFLDTSGGLLGLKSPGATLRKTSQDEFADLVLSIRRELETIKHHFDLFEFEGELNAALEADGVEVDETGAIIRENINLDKLRAAMQRAEELDSSRNSLSKHLKQLKEIGDVILEIRTAVAADQWDSMSATLEETVGGEGLHWPDYTRREISIVRSEVENRWIITNLTSALMTGRLHGNLGEVPLIDVTNSHLIGYISTAKSLKPRTEEAVRLLKAAERMSALRQMIMIKEINPAKLAAALNAIDWNAVKRTAKEIAMDVQQQRCHSIVLQEARLVADFAEDRMVCSAMEQALLMGGIKGRPGRLELQSLSTKELERAYQQAMRSPIKTENAKTLLLVCRIMLKLREVIKRAETTTVFEDSVEAWGTIKALLQEVAAAQRVEAVLNCWELCEEEIDLIQRHSVVQDMKASLIESSIEASHIYNERHTYVPQEDLSTLDIGAVELQLLNDELEKYVSVSREVSFQSENLSEYVACATSLRMFRSLVVEKKWEELETLASEKTLRGHLNLIKQVKAEFSWIMCELHNNKAISILRRALDGKETEEDNEHTDEATNKEASAVVPDEEWSFEVISHTSFTERNAKLAEAIAKAKKYRITSNVAKFWLEIAENMHSLRTSLEVKDNVSVAKSLRWFKSNGKVCPQALKVEAQRAYEIHQNDLLLHGLMRALSEGKPSGKRGEMDISTIETSAIESLLEQAQDIEPKVKEVAHLLGAAETILSVRKCLVVGDMIKLQGIMDDLSYDDSIPLEIIEEIAVARAELDNRTAIQSLTEALASFEDVESSNVDFTFLNNTSAPSSSSASTSVASSKGGKGLGASGSPSGAAASTTLSLDVTDGGLTAADSSDGTPRKKIQGMSILESFTNRRYSFANRTSSNIDPETIDTSALEKGMRLANLHGIFSDKAKRLFHTVDLVKSLRVAMKAFDWAEVESILTAAKYEERVGTFYDELATREIQAIRSQLDVRAAIVDLSKALKTGWAKCSHGMVDTSEMRNDILEDAIERADRSIQDLHIVDTNAGGLPSPIKTSTTGKKRVTFQDEVEGKERHQQTVSHQLTLLMRSAREVLRIRELLAVGSMEEAGHLAEKALSGELHYTVVEELRLYAKEINTALVSMRTAENLRLIALQGQLAPLQTAIQNALSSNIHLGSDLGIICTLTRAQHFYSQLQWLREKLIELQQEHHVGRLEDTLAIADKLRYGDEELEVVRQRLIALKHFESKCALVQSMWVYMHEERLLFRRLLFYAHEWKVANHPYSIRLNLYLKLSPASLNTIKLMNATQKQTLFTLVSQSIRHKHAYLELPSSVQRYRLENFPNLRRPEDYALRMTIISEELKRSMLLYSDQPLPTSLTKLPPQWAAIATFVFTACIRGLERNFFSHMDVILWQVVNLGRRCLLMRDELCLQLVKQMRENNEPTNVHRLWRILLACLYHFPVSRTFENYLESHLKQYAEEDYLHYRWARQAIRYLHRGLLLYGYDKLLPPLPKEQRGELRRWLFDVVYDPFLPKQVTDRVPSLLHSHLHTSSALTSPGLPHSNSTTSMKSAAEQEVSKQHQLLAHSGHSKSVGHHLTSSSSHSLQSLDEIINVDLGLDFLFPKTPSPPVIAPVVQTVTGLLGLQITVQQSVQYHTNSVSGKTTATPTSNAASTAASDAAAAAAASASAAAAEAMHVQYNSAQLRGVRENWILRFRHFNNNSTMKDGGYMTRAKFAFSLSATLTGKSDMDKIDRDIFYFLLLGKKMTYRGAIYREYMHDASVFHFVNDEETKCSRLRRQWLEQHMPVSDFSSELFFSQMQASDFLVYAERFWDQIIVKMSRECLHFPFLHWEREPEEGGTLGGSEAIERASDVAALHVSSSTSPSSSSSSAAAAATPRKKDPSTRRSFQFSESVDDSSSSDVRPGPGMMRKAVTSGQAGFSNSNKGTGGGKGRGHQGNNANGAAAVDAGPEISISWELYREIVLVGMKKFLQQFLAVPVATVPVHSAPSNAKAGSTPPTKGASSSNSGSSGAKGSSKQSSTGKKTSSNGSNSAKVTPPKGDGESKTSVSQISAQSMLETSVLVSPGYNGSAPSSPIRRGSFHRLEHHQQKGLMMRSKMEMPSDDEDDDEEEEEVVRVI